MTTATVLVGEQPTRIAVHEDAGWALTFSGEARDKLYLALTDLVDTPYCVEIVWEDGHRDHWWLRGMTEDAELWVQPFNGDLEHTDPMFADQPDPDEWETVPLAEVSAIHIY